MRYTHICFLLLAALWTVTASAERFILVENGEPRCRIIVDDRGSTVTHAWRKTVERHGSRTPRLLNTYYYSLDTAAEFLRERVEAATGGSLAVTPHDDDDAQGPAIVIGLAEHYPRIAAAAGLDDTRQPDQPLRSLDAFALHTTPDRLYILGRTELGCRHGVAMLLRELGFRFYNPSPRWWITPATDSLAIDSLAIDRSQSWTPAFFDLNLGTNAGHHLNHGNGTETYLWQTQGLWCAMNFGSGGAFSPSHRTRVGSFNARFIRDHKEELEANPQYFALDADGKRDSQLPLIKRRLCISNPGLMAILIQHRVSELDVQRRDDRFIPTVSGEYATYSRKVFDCHCEPCAQLGSQEDRYWYAVNQLARGLAEERPDAFIAFRALRPPTDPLEPNILVILSQHADPAEWTGKATQLGVTEGWKVYTPSSTTADPTQHLQRINQLIEQRCLSRGINIQSAWGNLTPTLYLVFQLSFDPAADADALLDAFYEDCFGDSATRMREAYRHLHAGDYRDEQHLRSVMAMALEAHDAEPSADVRARIVDVLAYLQGLRLYAPFEAELEEANGERGDAYYDALLPLMTYLCRQSFRHMMDPSDLAIRHCNRDALADDRQDFYWYRYEKFGQDPVWMDREFPWRGKDVVYMTDPRVPEQFHDDEVLTAVREEVARDK